MSPREKLSRTWLCTRAGTPTPPFAAAGAMLVLVGVAVADTLHSAGKPPEPPRPPH
ncbi:hypothetical protein ABZ807_23890 [Micromonospora sp. NPDC047548]|uniref:hypothetical protein n=1 Tax=Micromonospora sp. NPDC047548 TaxID=3155624 RepID=UPI0033FBAC9C